MDAAAKIKKQYGEISFDNPLIIFRYQRIDIETTSIIAYLHIAVILLVPVLFLVLKEISLPVYILIFIATLFLIFWLSSSLNKVEIDFFYKRIRIRNQFPWLDRIRKLMKRPVEFYFHDIASIHTTPGLYFGQNQLRHFLVISSVNHHTTRLAHFRDKEDAENLVQALQKFVLEKEEIIA